MIITMIRTLFGTVFVALLIACAPPQPDVLEGRPAGPYRLTLALDPERPLVGEETIVEFQLTYRKTGLPVRDLQIAHERLIHNFVVNLDFSSFAHIHHEDFYPLTEADRDNATLRFPYRFPSAGRYRIVSEFAHRNRSWTKHFDIVVENPAETQTPAVVATKLVDQRDGIRATLDLGAEPPVAGLESALTLELDRDGTPVTDLSLYLGSEMHGAVWREDGKFFGHLHSYTPKVAAILEMAHEEQLEAAARGARIQEMLVQLMCLDAELVFSGPTIPIKYVFPAPGRYVVFLEVAPREGPRVFKFGFEVLAGTTSSLDGVRPEQHRALVSR